MTFDDGVRLFLAGYFTFVAGIYAIRLMLGKPRQRLLFIGSFRSTHWWGHVTFRVFRILIWGVCLARVFYPGLDRTLGLFTILLQPGLQFFGVLLLIGGFALAVAGHVNLAEQWRSGIDPDGPTRLVSSKLFSLSRNPMTVGILIAQVGFFFALPSVFTLVCLLVGSTAVINQVRLEERHLQKKFPHEYRQYSTTVPRWLPVFLLKS